MEGQFYDQEQARRRKMGPIETIYNGYRFRSRTEARWALFFDTLGIPYDYEREGYNLDGVWYLPDFWLPKQDCWIEIKAEPPTERKEYVKVGSLTLVTQKPIFILWGDLQPFWQEAIELLSEEETQRILKETGEYPVNLRLINHGAFGHRFILEDGKVDWDIGYWTFAECSLCNQLGLASLGEVNSMHCKCASGLSLHKHDSPRLKDAYLRARQARF